jgi:CRISPR system Cascade subunit CasA
MGLSYRDWARLVLPTGADEPARVVAAFHDDGRGRLLSGDPLLWVFGYDMDNMKARCWYQQLTPLFHLDHQSRHELPAAVARCIAASEHCRKSAAAAVKAAVFRRPQDARGDTSFLSRSFWSRTEQAFFGTVSGLRDALRNGADIAPTMERWLVVLHEAALEVFRMHAQERGDFVAMEIGRVIKALKGLRSQTSPSSRKLRDLVNLPVAVPTEMRRSA